MHPIEETSQEELADLAADHEEHPPAEDEDAPLSFGGDEPMSAPTPLGQAVLEGAKYFLNIPLREDTGVNQDSQGYIRTFFVDGVPWKPDDWDLFIEKHRESVVAKPEWCAAFASYCVRKAHESLNRRLPTRLSASTTGLVKSFDSVGLFLRREKLFAEDGSIRKEATILPRPGDIVCFGCHTALLFEIYADGSFVTIEGNTYRGLPRKDGVYRCNRKANAKRADGTFALVGFCLLNVQEAEQSVPHVALRFAEAPAAAPAPAIAQTLVPSVHPPDLPAPSLGRGDKGQDVKTLQDRLNAWMKIRPNDTGLAVLSCDGSFGPKTEAALMAYQKLELAMSAPSGRTDEATQRSFAKYEASSLQKPKD